MTIKTAESQYSLIQPAPESAAMLSFVIIAIGAVAGMFIAEWTGFDRRVGFIVGGVAGAILSRFASSKGKW